MPLASARPCDCAPSFLNLCTRSIHRLLASDTVPYPIHIASTGRGDGITAARGWAAVGKSVNSLFTVLRFSTFKPVYSGRLATIVCWRTGRICVRYF